MIFTTRVAGIPCQCHVTRSRERIPNTPEYGEFDFHLLDRKGYRAPWLETKMTSDDILRLQEEFQLEMLGERGGYL